MKKNKQPPYNRFNLLNSTNFKTTLKFEAEYANTVKGGHLPDYVIGPKRKRLVNTINILSSEETQDLITYLFISKN